MRSMKRLWVLVTGLCIFSLLAGCGAKPAETEKVAGGKKEIEIVMWLIGSEGQALTIKE